MQTDLGNAVNVDLRALDVAVLLAGGIGAKLSQEGKTPGWVRRRTPADLTRFHETAHAIAASALGFSVFEIRLMPEGGGYTDYGTAGSKPALKVNEANFAELPNDQQRIDDCVRLLNEQGCFPDLAELTTIVESILRKHWRNVKWLAGELLRNRTMTEQEIAPFLPA